MYVRKFAIVGNTVPPLRTRHYKSYERIDISQRSALFKAWDEDLRKEVVAKIPFRPVPSIVREMNMSLHMNGCDNVPTCHGMFVGTFKKHRDVPYLLFDAALAVAQPGAFVNEIGRAIESTARAAGFTTLRDLGSHGVGRKLHEAPRFIPNFFDPTDRRRLAEGMVITIEPFLSLASERCTTADDGWTLLSGPGNRSAQFEHTLVITAGGPEVMTRP